MHSHSGAKPRPPRLWWLPPPPARGIPHAQGSGERPKPGRRREDGLALVLDHYGGRGKLVGPVGSCGADGWACLAHMHASCVGDDDVQGLLHEPPAHD